MGEMELRREGAVQRRAQGLAPWTGAGGVAACLRKKKGRRNGAMAAGGAELERGQRWRRLTTPRKTSNRSKQGRAQGAPGLGIHGYWPSRGIGHGDCWRPWSRRGHWGGDELGGPEALARWRRWLPAAAASQEEQGGLRAIAGRGKGRGAAKGVAPWEEGSRAPCALGKKAPCSAWGKKPGREESGG
jgi:hypothetical protein